MFSYKLVKANHPFDVLQHQQLLKKIWKKNKKKFCQKKRQGAIDYCNVPWKSKIRTMMPRFENLIDKSLFAKHTQKFQGEFIPKTWVVSQNPQIICTNAKTLFFLKPANGSRGNGIVVDPNPQKLCIKARTDPNNRYIIQQSVPRLLLTNDERKFDIRVWVCFVWIKSSTKKGSGDDNTALHCFTWSDAVVRVSTDKFDPNSVDPKIHLTNFCIQRNHRSFKKDKSILRASSMRELQWEKTYINIQRVLSKMRAVFAKVLQPRLSKTSGYWLAGFDFILDQDQKLWLLECNRNPGVSYTQNQTAIYFEALSALSTQIIEPLLSNKGLLLELTHSHNQWDLVF